MKRFHFFLIILASCTFSSSCNKILETKPVDFLSPVNYYETEIQITNALIGVYDALGHQYFYGDRFLANLSIGNDEGYYFTANIIGVENYSAGAEDTHITNLWNYLYQGINRANNLLENIDGSSVSEDFKRHVKGEVLFLRSFYFFTLVQWWGGVPLPLTATKSYQEGQLARTPAIDVYEQIISDMAMAESLLHDQTSTGLGFSGRVSRTVVQGMLARVCLFAAGVPFNQPAKYQEALNWAKKVKDSGEHELNPSYSQIFINQAQDIYDVKESMWEVEFYGNMLGEFASLRETGKVGVRAGIRQDVTDNGFCQGYNFTYPKLYFAYSENDERRDWAISPYSFRGNNTLEKVYLAANDIYNRYPGKWRREYERLRPFGRTDNGTNFPILRYADVLLMLAEAENEVNGPTPLALECINLVKSRAGLTDLYTTGSKEEFRQEIRDERFRELAWECLRSQDLRRWGILIETVRQVSEEANSGSENFPAAPTIRRVPASLPGTNIADRDVYWPIPTRDLALNKMLTQNPGW